jgi:cytochrome c-type biogenesis protein
MTDRIAEAMGAGGPWLVLLALLGGLCTSLNPCAYPMMGAVVAYVWANGERVASRSAVIAAVFLLGLAFVYCLLGALGSLLAPLLGLTKVQWAWIAGAVCIAAGVLMAEIITVEFRGFSLASRFWGRLKGLPGAFVLGALMGIVATPCATPPLVAILSIAAARQAVLLGAALMFVYAIGHGLPAIVIGLAAGRLGALQRFQAHGRALRLVGGWLLIALGVYLLLSA